MAGRRAKINIEETLLFRSYDARNLMQWLDVAALYFSDPRVGRFLTCAVGAKDCGWWIFILLSCLIPVVCMVDLSVVGLFGLSMDDVSDYKLCCFCCCHNCELYVI